VTGHEGWLGSNINSLFVILISSETKKATKKYKLGVGLSYTYFPQFYDYFDIGYKPIILSQNPAFDLRKKSRVPTFLQFFFTSPLLDLNVWRYIPKHPIIFHNLSWYVRKILRVSEVGLGSLHLIVYWCRIFSVRTFSLSLKMITKFEVCRTLLF